MTETNEENRCAHRMERQVSRENCEAFSVDLELAEPTAAPSGSHSFSPMHLSRHPSFVTECIYLCFSY